MARKVKVVWLEGVNTHSVLASLLGEEDGFLKLTLGNGFQMSLQKASVIKIEEVPQ